MPASGRVSPRALRASVPVEPVQTLILLAVIANLAVMGSVLLPPLLGRRGPLGPGITPIDAGQARVNMAAAVLGDGGLDLLAAAIYRRASPERRLEVHRALAAEEAAQRGSGAP